MGKMTRKLGLGLLLGAAAGHYFSTEKGQELLATVKKGLNEYQANPEAYQGEVRSFLETQLDRLKHVISTGTQTNVERSTGGAEVGDIIITYTEDDLTGMN